MSTTTLPRTQDEIIARYHATRDDDFLGFKAQVILSSLDFEHAKPFLKEGTTPEEWTPTLDAEALKAEALDYLAFAFGKAEDHRGISAERSVQKLEEFAWLLGRDDVVTAMGEAGYAMYGAPKLFAFAKGFEVEPPESEDLARMAQGKRCTSDYDCGCGR